MTQPDELLKAAEEYARTRGYDGDHESEMIQHFLDGHAHASAGWAEKLRERDEKIKSFERGLSEYRTEVTRLTKKWESSESSWDRHAAKLEAQLKLADELADRVGETIAHVPSVMIALAAYRKARG